ncbi:uncharacterized protein VICG_01008 [Vittaforma corneae ATCC 50505]|uniref:Uncharacterized protein n=1 Tax=Vittaforma corneae (strain ATCC 50505) TaxID=993615 RepID=L2GMB9_VITCO|nr:uncharacterized protein VICG_01008 [Vittaforma corneae ATCC 50505]ELA41991.1 hypothetical protein VICG_01008 [Vittaforma corneae ATCC 50505]
MTCVDFPTFTLKTTKNYVFVAGGGGNKDYGKQNGVVAFRKENISKELGDFEDFFQTDDFILHLQVYTSCEEEQDGQMERLLIRERPAIAEEFDPSDSEDACAEELSTTSEEKGAMEDGNKNDIQSVNEEAENENIVSKNGDDNKSKTGGDGSENKNEGDTRTKKEVLSSLQKNPIFVAGIGDKNFYLLRFDGKFSLCCVSNNKIRQAHLSEHLILLKNNIIAGFHNIIHQNKPTLNFKIKKFHEDTENLAEEYVYKLYKKKDEVVALNDHCTQDIPEDWFKFFIFGNSIHKVINENDKNTFVFHNQKYEIEGKLSNFIVQKSRIIFFANREKEGHLYFIDQSSKRYELPKITAIAQFNDTTCVATAQGDVIIYVDGVYSQKHSVATIPISGVGLDDSKIYFCILTGEIGCKKYSTSTHLVLKTASILVLVIAIIIAVIFKYKR